MLILRRAAAICSAGALFPAAPHPIWHRRLLALAALAVAWLTGGCGHPAPRSQEETPIVGGQTAGPRAPGARLARARLAGKDLEAADLRGADLSRADLSGANLDRAILTRAILSGAKMAHANLSSARLVEAKLGRADLGGARLVGADLTGATLTDANLEGADLTGARLSDANLSGAQLRNADLGGADLTGAHAQYASFDGARLGRARLFGANLTRARLSGAELAGAQFDGATQWPAGFRPDERGALRRGPGRLTILLTAAIILAAAYFVLRRAEIRLVLGLSAAALFALAGQFPQFFVVLAREMANERTIVPICSAMGFAYVMKITECDRHLVHLLVRPLRAFRALLIPGGVMVAYLVNTTVVSQSSTAATVGPVLLPLLAAAEVSPMTAGALLLLGASMGGELFNPGSVEITTLAGLTDQPSPGIVERVMLPNLIASAAALLVFWRLAVLWERRRLKAAAAPTGVSSDDATGLLAVDEVPFRVHPVKALVPLLPLALLFLGPTVLRLPREFSFEERMFDANSVSIAAAMLAGVAAAALTAPRLAGRAAAGFFEGAGHAYTIVISLIVVATLFAEGIRANGLIESLAQGLSGRASVATLASIGLPGLLAAASGSGIAPAVAVMKALVPVADRMHLDPVRMGALTAVAAQLGRTISPVAAVVITSAAISGTAPVDLARRVLPAVLAGAGVLLLAALLGVV
jgi:DcuC family C4-dicarboxylate transporter